MQNKLQSNTLNEKWKGKINDVVNAIVYIPMYRNRLDNISWFKHKRDRYTQDTPTLAELKRTDAWDAALKQNKNTYPLAYFQIKAEPQQQRIELQKEALRGDNFVVLQPNENYSANINNIDSLHETTPQKIQKQSQSNPQEIEKKKQTAHSFFNRLDNCHQQNDLGDLLQGADPSKYPNYNEIYKGKTKIFLEKLVSPEEWESKVGTLCASLQNQWGGGQELSDLDNKRKALQTEKENLSLVNLKTNTNQPQDNNARNNLLKLKQDCTNLNAKLTKDSSETLISPELFDKIKEIEKMRKEYSVDQIENNDIKLDLDLLICELKIIFQDKKIKKTHDSLKILEGKLKKVDYNTLDTNDKEQKKFNTAIGKFVVSLIELNIIHLEDYSSAIKFVINKVVKAAKYHLLLDKSTLIYLLDNIADTEYQKDTDRHREIGVIRGILNNVADNSFANKYIANMCKDKIDHEILNELREIPSLLENGSGEDENQEVNSLFKSFTRLLMLGIKQVSRPKIPKLDEEIAKINFARLTPVARANRYVNILQLKMFASSEDMKIQYTKDVENCLLNYEKSINELQYPEKDNHFRKLILIKATLGMKLTLADQNLFQNIEFSEYGGLNPFIFSCLVNNLKTIPEYDTLANYINNGCSLAIQRKELESSLVRKRETLESLTNKVIMQIKNNDIMINSFSIDNYNGRISGQHNLNTVISGEPTTLYTVSGRNAVMSSTKYKEKHSDRDIFLDITICDSGKLIFYLGTESNLDKLNSKKQWICIYTTPSSGILPYDGNIKDFFESLTKQINLVSISEEKLYLIIFQNQLKMQKEGEWDIELQQLEPTISIWRNLDQKDRVLPSYMVKKGSNFTLQSSKKIDDTLRKIGESLNDNSQLSEEGEYMRKVKNIRSFLKFLQNNRTLLKEEQQQQLDKLNGSLEFCAGTQEIQVEAPKIIEPIDINDSFECLVDKFEKNKDIMGAKGFKLKAEQKTQLEFLFNIIEVLTLNEDSRSNVPGQEINDSQIRTNELSEKKLILETYFNSNEEFMKQCKEKLKELHPQNEEIDNLNSYKIIKTLFIEKGMLSYFQLSMGGGKTSVIAPLATHIISRLRGIDDTAGVLFLYGTDAFLTQNKENAANLLSNLGLDVIDINLSDYNFNEGTLRNLLDTMTDKSDKSIAMPFALYTALKNYSDVLQNKDQDGDLMEIVLLRAIFKMLKKLPVIIDEVDTATGVKEINRQALTKKRDDPRIPSRLPSSQRHIFALYQYKQEHESKLTDEHLTELAQALIRQDPVYAKYVSNNERIKNIAKNSIFNLNDLSKAVSQLKINKDYGFLSNCSNEDEINSFLLVPYSSANTPDDKSKFGNSHVLSILYHNAYTELFKDTSKHDILAAKILRLLSLFKKTPSMANDLEKLLNCLNLTIDNLSAISLDEIKTKFKVQT